MDAIINLFRAIFEAIILFFKTDIPEKITAFIVTVITNFNDLVRHIIDLFVN